MSLINDQLKRASQFQQQEDDTVRINLKALSAAALKPQITCNLPPASKPQPSRDSAPAFKPQPTRDPAPESKPEPTWGWPAGLEIKKGRSALPVLVILLIATAGAFIGIVHLSKKLPAFTAKFHAPQPVQTTRPAPKPGSPPATGHTVAVTVHAPVLWPRLKIQGITYYDARWQAIVNGKTVHVGSTVNGIRVASISRNNVLFVAPDGSRKTLALGQ